MCVGDEEGKAGELSGLGCYDPSDGKGWRRHCRWRWDCDCDGHRRRHCWSGVVVV